eukprot:1138898-Pelagomonas_calceolata.AAC.1
MSRAESLRECVLSILYYKQMLVRSPEPWCLFKREGDEGDEIHRSSQGGPESRDFPSPKACLDQRLIGSHSMNAS